MNEKLTDEQKEKVRWYTYLYSNITHAHALALYELELKEKGKDSADLLKKRINWVKRNNFLI